MNRIEKKFRELKRSNRKAFIVFITAGYPSINVTYNLILELSRIGVDIIELGVPFSDPLADGPVIQESSQYALAHNVKLSQILSLVKKARKAVETPICLMTYYNPVFCFGEEHFVKQAVASGVDGVIVPDLPPEEAKTLIRLSAREGLDTIFFLAPTSTPERIKMISKFSKGFIYYVSLTGVTGARQELPGDIVKNIKAIKTHTQKPVCVGFGVSTPQQVKNISRVCEGVIVGSAVIKKIKENLGRPDLVEKTGKFIAYLKHV